MRSLLAVGMLIVREHAPLAVALPTEKARPYAHSHKCYPVRQLPLAGSPEQPERPCITQSDRGNTHHVAGIFTRHHGNPRVRAGAVVTAPTDETPDPTAEDQEKGPLVDRLERLKWPEAPADLRERCLKELMEKLESGEPQRD